MQKSYVLSQEGPSLHERYFLKPFKSVFVLLQAKLYVPFLPCPV